MMSSSRFQRAFMACSLVRSTPPVTSQPSRANAPLPGGMWQVRRRDRLRSASGAPMLDGSTVLDAKDVDGATNDVLAADATPLPRDPDNDAVTEAKRSSIRTSRSRYEAKFVRTTKANPSTPRSGSPAFRSGTPDAPQRPAGCGRTTGCGRTPPAASSCSTWAETASTSTTTGSASRRSRPGSPAAERSCLLN
jgi:hypothetical protein